MSKARIKAPLELQDCYFCNRHEAHCLNLSQKDKVQGNQLLVICMACLKRGVQMLYAKVG